MPRKPYGREDALAAMLLIALVFPDLLRTMWEVDNQTEFAADRGWVRDRDGTEVWLVAVKATFDVLPDGTTQVSEHQPDIVRVPVYNGEPGRSSLRYESDLILRKSTTDITLCGHAHAPGGEAVKSLDVGLRVGNLKKVLRVFGDRTWSGLGPSSPEPFVTMPLVYERAFGGVDPASSHPQRDWEWRNPVGTGFTCSRSGAAIVRLPNIEYPNQLMRSWNDRPAPAGFGPVAAHWQPRASFAGTYDNEWMQKRQPLLPPDFDERFYHCAPQDLQSPTPMRGGEPVVLLNVSPFGPLRFLLPKIFLGFETRFRGAEAQIHRYRRLHSIILEPDFPRVSLVWLSALPCHHRVHKLLRTIVTLKYDVREAPEVPLDQLEMELM